MRRWVALSSLLVAAPLAASPPPPPPPWVWAAGEVLARPRPGDDAKAAPLFADDVVATLNGTVVARGKASLLTWRQKNMGFQQSTLGYSEGWSRNGGGGELLVLDSVEDFDRATLPATMLVDPRRAVRSTLYRFGAGDHLIHFVDVSRAEGFLMT